MPLKVTNANLNDVVQEFMKAAPAKTYEGHDYLIINEKNQLEASPCTNGRISFEEITEIFKQVIHNQTLSPENRSEMIRAFTVITDKFDKKKLGPLDSLFFESSKQMQVAKAKNLITVAKSSGENSYSVLDKREKVNLKDMTEWNHFVVRDPNWDNLAIYNTSGSQRPYGEKMQQAVVVVTDLIQNESSFKNVCYHACTLRNFIAKDLNQVHSQAFGHLRNNYSQTPLKGIYSDLGDFWKQKHNEVRNNQENSPFYLAENEGYGAVIGTINDKPIQLSTMYESLDGSGAVHLEHTDPDLIPEIMEYVEDIYNQILKEKDPDKVQELAGLMFWWICQAKPWQRGDPSIAEIIIRSVFAAKQMPNLPWKPGVVPWVEAMKDFDSNQFSQRFSTLFDSK